MIRDTKAKRSAAEAIEMGLVETGLYSEPIEVEVLGVVQGPVVRGQLLRAGEAVVPLEGVCAPSGAPQGGEGDSDPADEGDAL